MSVKSLTPFSLFSPRTMWLYCFSRDPVKNLFSLGWKSYSRGHVKLIVNKKISLVDDSLSVNVVGLSPFQEITVMATTTSTESKKQITFGAYGQFKASGDGCVDLSRDPSLNGTYTGVEPMGLFWSMVQNPHQRKYARLVKYDATTPLLYDLAVFPQHVSSESLWRLEHKPLAHTEIQRLYKKPNVKKITVDEAGIYGSLFIPEREEKGTGRSLPAVIDMYGSNGGLVESRAALLANRGFITLSLPYFKYKDLSITYFDIDFEYFEKAVDWLLNHPSVMASNNNGVGILGSSLGGTLSLYLAAHCPKVKAAVSISGPAAFFLRGIRHNGKVVPSVDIKYSTFIKDEQHADLYTNPWTLDETKVFTIPASSKTKIMLLVGDDDTILTPDNYEKWIQRHPTSKRSDIELVVYPDTGHIIEPPYTPVTHNCYASVYGHAIRFGGTPAPQARAQENMWPKIIEFFKKNL